MHDHTLISSSWSLEFLIRTSWLGERRKKRFPVEKAMRSQCKGWAMARRAPGRREVKYNFEQSNQFDQYAKHKITVTHRKTVGAKGVQ
jgi:hypothetical protein